MNQTIGKKIYVILFFSQVTSSDPTLIEILPPESDISTSSAMVYPVRLREAGTIWEQLRNDLSLDFSCQLTGQRIHIPIYIKLVERKEVIQGRSNLLKSPTHFSLSFFYWYLLLSAGQGQIKVT